jgi:hypothetical protein
MQEARVQRPEQRSSVNDEVVDWTALQVSALLLDAGVWASQTGAVLLLGVRLVLSIG